MLRPGRRPGHQNELGGHRGQPDFAVPAAEAFARAYALAIEKLATGAADPRRKAEYEWILSGEKSRQNPPRLEAKVLKAYAGVYGERKITFENGKLFYQGPDRSSGSSP